MRTVSYTVQERNYPDEGVRYFALVELETVEFTTHVEFNEYDLPGCFDTLEAATAARAEFLNVILLNWEKP